MGTLLPTQLDAQTVLKHNELTFSNGTGFLDTISEDLPVDTIPGSVEYEDYISYVYGFSVYDLGTVNVSGGAATNILFGKWVGEYTIPTSDNYYAGIEGITDAGKRGSNGDGDAINYNAFSDIQISKAINEESLWLRSNTNDKNQIDAYSGIDVAFNPVFQLSLALQAEGGDISIQDKFIVDASLSSDGHVGIGTTTPSAHLHVAGNVKARQLFGDIGKTVLLDYYDVLIGNQGAPNSGSPGVFNGSTQRFGSYYEGYAVTCYVTQFSTTDWPSAMNSFIILSWYEWMSTGYDDEVIHKLFLYENTMSSGTIVAQSAPVSFDFHSHSTIKDFSVFLNYTLQPNKTYYLQLVGAIETGAAGTGVAQGIPYIYNISGFVYAVP